MTFLSHESNNNNYFLLALRLIWPLFILFVAGHLFANYNAVKSVIIQTFNRNRFHIITQAYFKQNVILLPYDCNRSEPVLWTVSRFFRNIKLGCCIREFKNLSSDQLETLKNNKYSIEFDIKSNKYFDYYCTHSDHYFNIIQ